MDGWKLWIIIEAFFTNTVKKSFQPLTIFAEKLHHIFPKVLHTLLFDLVHMRQFPYTFHYGIEDLSILLNNLVMGLNLHTLFKSIKTPVFPACFNKNAGLQICNFIKKRLQRMCFPANIATIINNGFFIQHLWWLLFILRMDINKFN